jgi:hypothetical protein
MGKRQRAAIKGDVTGVVITPTVKGEARTRRRRFRSGVTAGVTVCLPGQAEKTAADGVFDAPTSSLQGAEALRV